MKKKIYKYKVMGSWHSKKCDMCKGSGGEWERVKVLVGEEVVE